MSSSWATCLLTALWVMCSSRAALVKLRWRAAASKHWRAAVEGYLRVGSVLMVLF